VPAHRQPDAGDDDEEQAYRDGDRVQRDGPDRRGPLTAPPAVDQDHDRRDDEERESQEGREVPPEQLEGLADQLAERAMAVEVEPHPFTR
jgi:hypothetical protein